MEAWSEALQILSTAEAELRKLIERSLNERRYEDVVALARLVDEVSRLGPLANTEQLSRTVEISGQKEPVPQKKEEARKAGKGGRSTEFPRFERDGDRLVKIAWSKRDRSEYEHRAPRYVVDQLIAAIKAKRGEGAEFAPAEVFPLKDSDDSREIPSYQAYLALAWLRYEGVIIKEGRDRYSLKPRAATAVRIDELWKALRVKRK